MEKNKNIKKKKMIENDNHDIAFSLFFFFITYTPQFEYTS